MAGDMDTQVGRATARTPVPLEHPNGTRIEWESTDGVFMAARDDDDLAHPGEPWLVNGVWRSWAWMAAQWPASLADAHRLVAVDAAGADPLARIRQILDDMHDPNNPDPQRWDRHGNHKYSAGCPVCMSESETLAAELAMALAAAGLLRDQPVSNQHPPSCSECGRPMLCRLCPLPESEKR